MDCASGVVIHVDQALVRNKFYNLLTKIESPLCGIGVTHRSKNMNEVRARRGISINYRNNLTFNPNFDICYNELQI